MALVGDAESHFFSTARCKDVALFFFFFLLSAVINVLPLDLIDLELKAGNCSREPRPFILSLGPACHTRRLSPTLQTNPQMAHQSCKPVRRGVKLKLQIKSVGEERNKELHKRPGWAADGGAVC